VLHEVSSDRLAFSGELRDRARRRGDPCPRDSTRRACAATPSAVYMVTLMRTIRKANIDLRCHRGGVLTQAPDAERAFAPRPLHARADAAGRLGGP
jgi:hypothetical protein